MHNICDFPNSYLTFTVPDGSNTARIQLDARCTVTDSEAGASEEFFLITPCKSEHMYVDTTLFQNPNFDFCGVWSHTHFILLRTFASHQSGRPIKERESGPHAPRFGEVKIDLNMLQQTKQLHTGKEIVKATLDNQALVARTYLQCGKGGRTALLEYPVKTMNVAVGSVQFQVDTGPLIVPDCCLPNDPDAPVGVDHMSLAFICYKDLARVDFVLRQPTAVEPGEATVMHYSKILTMAARHELFAVSGSAA